LANTDDTLYITVVRSRVLYINKNRYVSRSKYVQSTYINTNTERDKDCKTNAPLQKDPELEVKMSPGITRCLSWRASFSRAGAATSSGRHREACESACWYVGH
jgi:hypothetical protein